MLTNESIFTLKPQQLSVLLLEFSFVVFIVWLCSDTVVTNLEDYLRLSWTTILYYLRQLSQTILDYPIYICLIINNIPKSNIKHLIILTSYLI